jgi:hypothetical protein
MDIRAQLRRNAIKLKSVNYKVKYMPPQKLWLFCPECRRETSHIFKGEIQTFGKLKGRKPCVYACEECGRTAKTMTK